MTIQNLTLSHEDKLLSHPLRKLGHIHNVLLLMLLFVTRKIRHVSFMLADIPSNLHFLIPINSNYSHFRKCTKKLAAETFLLVVFFYYYLLLLLLSLTAGFTQALLVQILLVYNEKKTYLIMGKHFNILK